MSSHSADPSRPSVAVVVLASGDADVASTLQAVSQQVYESDATVVVGVPAPKSGATIHADTVLEALDSIDRSVTHVWFVRVGAVPNREALGALVSESVRVGAGIAGSKVLANDGSNRLLELGMATDVFGAPYSGLDPDEIDAGQYDVVRDVAWVSSTSMLVRRDLLRGLGGPDPDLARGAAAIDLCQRARLRGARVVVVPSAVVPAPPDIVDHRGWRERAGQLRAVTVVYSALTLLWVLPLRFLIGLVEAVLAPFVGRWTLFSWVRAWVWFLATMPATIARRRATRTGLAVPDEELFRFQVQGSARLKVIGSSLVTAVRERIPQDERFTLAGLGRDLRRPSISAAIATVLFALMATRSMWSGFPTAGFLAPLGADANTALDAYAGGWNPAGLGSSYVVDPLVGAMGVVQWLLLGDPGLATGVVTLAAVVGAMWGMVRLLQPLGIDIAPGLAAGVVLMAGPATRALAAETAFGEIIAVALLPWVVRTMTAPWPERWIRRLANLASVAALSAILAAFAPLVLGVAMVASLAWVVLVTRRSRVSGPVSVLIGAGAAWAALRPWTTSVDMGWLVSDGSAYWQPGLVVAVLLGVMVVVSLLAVPGLLARGALWASSVGVAGALLARLDLFGVGRRPQAVGLAAVALGSAVVVGVAIEAITRNSDSGVRRTVVALGAVAAGLVVVSASIVLVGGRLGLPGGTFADMVAFVAAGDEGGEARVLLLGVDDELPGAARSIDGAVYRLVAAPQPDLAAVMAAPLTAADAALEGALREIVTGTTQRAGDVLAPFGIRWVVIVGDSPFQPLLEHQLDLVPLSGLRRTTFLNDSDAARAVTDAGDVWRWDGSAYVGTPLPGGRVVLAETAHSGWGPAPWEQSDWANSVDASTGKAEFAGAAGRSAAAATGLGLFIGLALLAIVLRRWP